jgi:hypothetical protein
MGWPATRESLGRFLVAHGLVGVGVEVGVFLGNYSECILRTWPGELVLVDAWRHLPEFHDPWNFDDEKFEQILASVRERVRPFGARARIVRALSDEASRLFSDGQFDFVYLDGDHSYRSCRADLELWWPKVKQGGLFCGHDYLHGVFQGKDIVELAEPTPQSLQAFGVKAAVDEFAAKLGCQVNTTEDHPKSWWFFKQCSR